MIMMARLASLLPTTERLTSIGLGLAITIVVALVVLRLLFAAITRIERLIKTAGGGSVHAEQRARTLGGIMRSLTTLVIGLGTLIQGLGVIGWNIGPLLAGAGVLGVAIGFGAQTMVRDFIAGMFILAEDQFAVGETVEVNGRPATVEAISVRMTTLRDMDGYLHFVPNGEMRIVTNRSRGWARVIADVIVMPDQDVDRALDACREAAHAFSHDPAWRDRLHEPAHVWGVEAVGVNEIRVRVTTRTAPGLDAGEAGRELRLRLLHALARARVGSEVRTPEVVAGAPAGVGMHSHEVEHSAPTR